MLASEEPFEYEEFTTPMVIGVVADTHLSSARTPLPRSLVDGLHAVDLIVHVGDIVTRDALALFEVLGEVRAVSGNNDDVELRRSLPARRYFRVGSFTVGVIHGDGFARLTARQATERIMGDKVDMAIFGHSHRAVCEWVGKTLLFNPGSATNKRWEPHHSFGVIRVAQEIDARLYYF